MSRVLLLAFLAALLLFPIGARAGVSDVVVSQIYGGGGNAGATFRNDYVELFNAGSSTVDLSGWTVQYATAAGTSWQPTALSGAIAAGHYYLVQLASNADVGDPLPAADATGTSNLGGTSGKIALVRGRCRTHVWRFGGKLLGRLTGGGSRRLRQRERLRRCGLGGGAFQHLGSASRERRLHRHR